MDKGGTRVDLARLGVELKRAAFVAATESLERTQKLRDGGLITCDALYDCESSQQSAARALFTRSEVLLGGANPDDAAFKENLISRLAPIEGVVGSVGLAEDQTVTSTSAAAVTIADDLQFIAYVDQGNFGKMNLGQTGMLYLIANSSAQFVVTVSPIEPSASGVARRSSEQPPRTFPVSFSINDGQIGPVSLAEGMGGYVIPSKALMRYSGGEGSVMTLDEENKVVLRRVTFTWSDGTNVGISNGLDQGERVIVGGQTALVQGDVIEPLE